MPWWPPASRSKYMPMPARAQRCHLARCAPGAGCHRPQSWVGALHASGGAASAPATAGVVHTNSLKAGVYGGLAARAAGIPRSGMSETGSPPDYLPGSGCRGDQVSDRQDGGRLYREFGGDVADRSDLWRSDRACIRSCRRSDHRPTGNTTRSDAEPDSVRHRRTPRGMERPGRLLAGVRWGIPRR